MLAAFCDESFLKLWSYPNPYRDDAKELCDLLAVFENHVFIFFDRESRRLDVPDKDPLVSWNRWRKEVIDAQVRSVHGAERYLRQGRGVYLDNALTVPFPININLSQAIVHKIIVAHGAKEACERFSSSNVYGSLGISYGDLASRTPPPFPFIIHVDRENPVHILDTHNLPIILGELDTFQDFSLYLDAKLEAIRKYACLVYCGEEDLLAHYLLNLDPDTKRHYIGLRKGEYDVVMIGEGEWKDFIQLPQYRNKKVADEVSYLWDDVIQRTCQNALDGTLLGDAKLLEGKSAIHEMAKEPRVMRRALCERIANAIREFPETPAELMRMITYMESFYENKAYVFLQLKVTNIRDYENEYRPKKRAMLELACGAAKNKYSHLKKIIGIAIDASKFSKARNAEDFLLMDCEEWTDEMKQHYEKGNEGLGFFQTGTGGKARIMEFPLPPEK